MKIEWEGSGASTSIGIVLTLVVCFGSQQCFIRLILSRILSCISSALRNSLQVFVLLQLFEYKLLEMFPYSWPIATDYLLLSRLVILLWEFYFPKHLC